jgi:AcrR family transcriptional regulator
MPPSRRDDLIDAAMRVFCQHGFHASGLDSILEAGGISRMTVYNHFKSKDELIVAAMRRRDEIFRNRMMKYVDSHATEPRERILAVFDYHQHWFTSGEFFGCMFINAAAEYSDPQCAVRQLAAEHKRLVLLYLEDLCAAASVPEPAAIAAQLNLLIEGAIVTAYVADQPKVSRDAAGRAAVLARQMASRILNAAQSPHI